MPTAIRKRFDFEELPDLPFFTVDAISMSSDHKCMKLMLSNQNLYMVSPMLSNDFKGLSRMSGVR